MSLRPRRARATVAAASLLLAAAALPVAAAGAPMPGNPDPVHAGPDPAAVNAALGLVESEVVSLNIDTTYGVPVRFVLPLGGGDAGGAVGEALPLDLWPFSVRAPGYQLLEDRGDGLLHEVDPGPINTLRGVVTGLDGSICAGGMMPDGLYLTVALPDGRQYWLEPLVNRVPGADKSHYVVYRNGAVVDSGGICGSTNDQRLLGDHVDHAPGSPGERGTTRWTAQLATDADWEYYNIWGGTGNVASRIAIILNVVNLQYERDVDIFHTISVSVVRTTSADPYTATEEAVMNQQITAAWAGQAGTWDLIHVFTGTDRDLTGSVIGRANAIGSVCGAQNSNCWSWVEFSSNFSSQTDLMAHEMGHLWDGVHCTCSSPESTMNPSISSINRFGVNPNDVADTDIPVYRNSRPCLSSAGSTTPPPNDNCTSADRIFTGTYAFNTISATTDGPAVSSCDGAANANRDVWYLYIAPCDGTLTVETCTADDETRFDTVLAAYTGACGALVQVACDDDTAGCGSGFQSRISFPVTFNTSYRIRVGRFADADMTNGILTVSQTGCPAPSNNNCGSAITILANTDVPFSTIGASTDGPIEPLLCANASDDSVTQDVWFRWVATCTGSVSVSTCGSSYDTRLAIYNSCPSSTPNQAIACDDDDCPVGLQSLLTFNATSGADYFIRIGGYNNQEGTGTLRVDACPPPANDLCSNAINVSGGGVFNGTLVNATSDGTATCGASAGQPDVWYSYTASCGGVLRVTTCGTHDAGGPSTGMDTVLALFSGCGGSELACNDDTNSCGALDGGTLRDSAVSTSMSPGQTVLIRASRFSTVAAGPFTLRVEFPGNDFCANAQAVGLGPTPFCNIGATNDGPNEAGTCFQNNDIWYRVTAPCNAPLRVSTCGATYDTEVSIYGGACPAAAGSVIACNDDSCGLQTNVTFPATSGTQYLIRVGSFGIASEGSGTLSIRIAGDWNDDGNINSTDISAYLSAWLFSINNFTNSADFNNDNSVNSTDISAFLSAWLAAVNNC